MKLAPLSAISNQHSTMLFCYEFSNAINFKFESGKKKWVDIENVANYKCFGKTKWNLDIFFTGTSGSGKYLQLKLNVNWFLCRINSA